jgi:FAD/FMN-containing dehydrogenase
MTGLVDGARPARDEVILSLERLNQIETINPMERVAVVQAGVTLQAAQEAAQDRSLLLAADWGARGSATIGGAIATNGGGLNVIRYGMMRDQVLGLEVVLSDGTVLPMMNRLVKNNTGYDLKQLFIGSEGTLGVITRAVLRLRAATRTENTALIATNGMTEAVQLFSMMDEQLGGNLTAFEALWPSFYELMVSQSGGQPPLPIGSSLYVLIESRGTHPDHDASQFESALAHAAEKGLVTDAVICASQSQRNALWAIREDIPQLAAALKPMIVFDVSLPITSMETYLDRLWPRVGAKFPNSRGVVFGHVGDCNLHLCWHVGSDDEATRVALSTLVYEELGPLGGSISAEHGIGREKRAYLGLSRTAEEIDWMYHVKELFDPLCILNADRVIPSIHKRKSRLS